jgi:hypothetical protein
MGNVTSNLQIWSPDEDDQHEPDVNMATMAASIENGVGPRLNLQEMAIGLKAGFTSPPTLSSTMTNAAVTINTSNGSFKQGLDISAGIVTVITPGMYLLSGSVGVDNVSGHTAKIELRKGATVIASDEMASNASFYQTAKATTIANCNAGDNLTMRIGDAAGGASVAANLALTHFTVAMIQAVPQ